MATRSSRFVSHAAGVSRVWNVRTHHWELAFEWSRAIYGCRLSGCRLGFARGIDTVMPDDPWVWTTRGPCLTFLHAPSPSSSLPISAWRGFPKLRTTNRTLPIATPIVGLWGQGQVMSLSSFRSEDGVCTTARDRKLRFYGLAGWAKAVLHNAGVYRPTFLTGSRARSDRRAYMHYLIVCRRSGPAHWEQWGGSRRTNQVDEFRVPKFWSSIARGCGMMFLLEMTC